MTAETPNPGAIRILVYDDDRLLLEVLVTMLRRQGYQVTGIHSEEEAIALACNQHFDLAAVDLGRQRSKGYDLVAELGAKGQATLVLAMSAYPALEVVRFAREHAQAFLEKPFSIAELLGAVRLLLAPEQPSVGGLLEDHAAAPRALRAARLAEGFVVRQVGADAGGPDKGSWFQQGRKGDV